MFFSIENTRFIKKYFRIFPKSLLFLNVWQLRFGCFQFLVKIFAILLLLSAQTYFLYIRLLSSHQQISSPKNKNAKEHFAHSIVLCLSRRAATPLSRVNALRKYYLGCNATLCASIVYLYRYS